MPSSIVFEGHHIVLCLAMKRLRNSRHTISPQKHCHQSPKHLRDKYALIEGPYIIEEVYRSGAIKMNNFEGINPKVVNGQTIKHYISGNPINVETNLIDTVTLEEYIRDTFQNVLDSEKE